MKKSKILSSLEKEESSKKTVQSKFTILVDTREQKKYRFEGVTYYEDTEHYSFDNIRSTYSGEKRVIVPTEHCALATGRGDYGVLNYPGVGIERKSMGDLYGTVADNFETKKFDKKLALMSSNLDYAAVVVEAERSELLEAPPRYTALRPQSLVRKVDAWTVEFPAVHWFFCPNRGDAENLTYFLLSKYVEYKTADGGERNPLEKRFRLYREGYSAGARGVPFTAWPEEGDWAQDWAKGWEDARKERKVK